MTPVIYGCYFPLHEGRPGAETFQPIDLDYIVSVGPIHSESYGRGSTISESYSQFFIYIKIGQPIPIWHRSGDIHADHPELVENLTKERQKLIDAWTNKKEINQ